MWSHIFLFGILLRRRPSEFTAILMFEFWREATAASVPGFLCQSGRRRPENVSILSSLLLYWIAGIGIVIHYKHNLIHSYIQSLNPILKNIKI